MQKRILSVLILLSFLVLSSNVYAASLVVTKIGALDTGGNTYPQWWYTASNPVFAGTAPAGATVDITVNDASTSVTADGSGNWSYASNLTSGDHSLKFEADGSSYSFLLSITQTLPESFSSGTSVETTQSTVPIPDTGVNTVAGLVVSVSAIALGTYFYDRNNSKKDFENSVINKL